MHCSCALRTVCLVGSPCRCLICSPADRKGWRLDELLVFISIRLHFIRAYVMHRWTQVPTFIIVTERLIAAQAPARGRTHMKMRLQELPGLERNCNRIHVHEYEKLMSPFSSSPSRHCFAFAAVDHRPRFGACRLVPSFSLHAPSATLESAANPAAAACPTRQRHCISKDEREGKCRVK